MKKILPILLFILAPFLVNAQSELDKKVNEIKGKVDEIIIKSDGKEYSFSGDEAEQLFDSMKQDKKAKHFEFFTDDGKVFTGDSLIKKFVFKDKNDSDSESNIMVFINEDDDCDSMGKDFKKIKKEINVTGDDGNKVVTVTTNEDGKENIEVYEGKAAEEYLDKINDEKCSDEKDEHKDTDCKKMKKIIIEKKDKSE